SKVASSEDAEIGAYGDGGDPPEPEELGVTTTPTVSGALTNSERWSGEIALTDTVTVNFPHILVIDPGTTITVPEDAALDINSIIRILGSEESPVTIKAAEGDGAWSGILLDSSAAGSTIRYARISGATYCIQSNSAVDDINNN
ncbi:hypothetical protein, partial [uncultured Paraglaciecola sp.]|uniref:hypothetical protein n=1 Tax=uncultured Paraglaciecola sp. TaxID=1765024 RepID=UPI002591D40F